MVRAKLPVFQFIEANKKIRLLASAAKPIVIVAIVRVELVTIRGTDVPRCVAPGAAPYACEISRRRPAEPLKHLAQIFPLDKVHHQVLTLARQTEMVDHFG